MKKVLIFAGIAVAAVFAIGLAKDMIIKGVVEGAVRQKTGFPLNIKSFRLGVLRSFVDIRGLELRNPSKFSERHMIDAPEIYVDYKIGSFLKGRAHFEEIRLSVREIVIVKNANGELNLNELKGSGGTGSAKPAAEKPAGQKRSGKGGISALQIDRLHLEIGKVVYKDFSGGGAPRIEEFPININETHENISGLDPVIGLIMGKVLLKRRLRDFRVSM